ncbi:MAG: CopG family transcriptional regulator [Deltaproteobacteria bacterium]|nr:CopG family transcriptional regulator [Deltaproteobacteria bacterium]
MPGIKTAISLEEELFNKVKKLAKEMNLSRSKLFSLAVKDFLQKQENKKILAQLNSAYSDSQNEEDAVSKGMHRKQREIVGRESW